MASCRGRRCQKRSNYSAEFRPDAASEGSQYAVTPAPIATALNLSCQLATRGQIQMTKRIKERLAIAFCFEIEKITNDEELIRSLAKHLVEIVSIFEEVSIPRSRRETEKRLALRANGGN